jgi:enterochelin esterase-like enzyme
MKILLSIFAAIALTTAAQAADVSGTWKAEFDTQRGLQKYTITLKQDGATVTGKASVETADQKRDVEFKEVKVEGDTVTFVETLNAQGTDLRIVYTGKISGNEIKFARKVGDISTTEAVAKKEAAPAPAPVAAAQPAAAQPAAGGARAGRAGGIAPVAPQAPEEGMAAYPVPPEGFKTERANIPHGDLKIVEYDSKTLGTRRLMRVYTPPGYSAARKYPVLYLHHGLGNTGTEWLRAGAQIIADNLLADGKMQPMIIVFPSGSATATAADETLGTRDAAAFGTPYENDLLKEIVPFVESHYSVDTDRSHRAIAGMSMGSGQTLNIGLSHLDVFGSVAGVAAAPNTKPVATLIPDPAALKQLKLLWLGVGNRDPLMRTSLGIHTFLVEKGVPHIWRLDGGAHDPTEMGHNFYHFSQLLFKEEPAPTKPGTAKAPGQAN